MIDNLQSMADTLRGCDLVRTTDRLEKGHLRLETHFLYPDGSMMELYLANGAGDLFNAFTLTDFGNTLAWLGYLGIDPTRQKRRRAIMQDVLDNYGITRDGAALSCRITEAKDIPVALCRLGQACVRVADISYLLRFRSTGLFAEDVEEIIAETSLEYELEASLPGKLGAVKVDALVNAPRLPTAVMLLPTRAMAATQLRTKSEHVFTTFYDLEAWPGQRLGIVEEAMDLYSSVDINRLTALGVRITSTANRAEIGAMLRGLAG